MTTTTTETRTGPTIARALELAEALELEQLADRHRAAAARGDELRRAAVARVLALVPELGELENAADLVSDDAGRISGVRVTFDETTGDGEPLTLLVTSVSAWCTAEALDYADVHLQRVCPRCEAFVTVDAGATPTVTSLATLGIALGAPIPEHETGRWDDRAGAARCDGRDEYLAPPMPSPPAWKVIAPTLEELEGALNQLQADGYEARWVLETATPPAIVARRCA